MDKTFRQLVLEAAKDADLSLGERIKLRIILRRAPDVLANELFNHCQAEGKIPVSANIDDVVGAPDWEKFFSALGSFIKEILPLILKILPLIL